MAKKKGNLKLDHITLVYEILTLKSGPSPHQLAFVRSNKLTTLKRSRPIIQITLLVPLANNSSGFVRMSFLVTLS